MSTELNKPASEDQQAEETAKVESTETSNESAKAEQPVEEVKADKEAPTATEESKEEESPKEPEKPSGPDPENYEDKSLADIVKLMEKWLKEFEVQHLKTAAEEARTHFFKKLKAEKAEKLSKFVADGGEEADFEFISTEKQEFQKLWDEYQARRKRRREKIEADMAEGLKNRLAIIEEMKTLSEGEEKLKETFQHFRELQEKWRNAGPVPRAQSSEVYRNYHFQVERFYDYVKINDELRDLDFKKNLEHKEALIAKAEELLDKKNIHKAFNELQSLHKKWKTQGGPVAREVRESVWERFSEITNKIHEKRREVLAKEKLQDEKVIAAKRALIEEMKGLLNKLPKDHRGWQDLLKKGEGIFDKFKKAGHIHGDENESIWNEFKETRSNLNHAKNEFYRKHKQVLSENLEKLKTIAMEAEASVENEDLTETANYLKGLQANWKKVQPVSRKEADKYWKRFRAACNAFFERIEKKKGADIEAQKENAKKKAEWLKEQADFKLSEAKDEALKQISEKQEEWRAMGQVTKETLKDLNDQYRKLVVDWFKKLDLDKAAQAEFKTKNKLDEMLSAGQENQAQRYVEDLKKTWNNNKAELMKLETNLSFFTNSSSGKNPLFAEAEKKVKQQQNIVEKSEVEFKTASKALRIYRQAQEREDV